MLEVFDSTIAEAPVWDEGPESVVDQEAFFEQLEATEPGAELGALLDGVERSSLNGFRLVTVMAAEERQAAHYQACKYATMAELAHCPSGDSDSPPERTDWIDFDEFVSDEISAALCLTRRGAADQLGVALDLWEKLPQLGKALSRGEIDLYRARRVITTTEHLSEEEARWAVGQVIDEAGDWTTGQVGARLRRVVLSEFGDREKEHYEYGLEQRAVKAYPNPDGTANLIASSLPGDSVAAIMRKLTALAKQAKTPDDSRGIDQRRADVFTDLLLNETSGPSSDRSVVDIRVDLTTLLELSDAPGEIPGWAPVISDIARQIVSENHDGEWRWAVTDPDSGAVHADGTTRRRPTNRQRRWVEARRPRCVFPGCRMPARDSDIDHTKSRADDGHTVVKNLAPLCKHHHRLKHETPWQLHRNDDTYVWTSPHGHTYTTKGQSP